MASRTENKKTAVKKTTTAGKTNKKTGGSRKTTAARQIGSSRTTGKSAAVTTQREKEPVPAMMEQTSPVLVKEAALWLILAVCIFIFISYFEIGGYLGGIISDVSFGTFGAAAYLFPLLVFIASAFLISNRGSRIAGVKFVSAVVLYLTVCSFLGLLNWEEKTATGVLEIYEQSAATKAGGGAAGGAVCQLLCPAMGTVGTGIILGILAIICLILITQRSILRFMKSQSKKMYESARESKEKRREARLLERQLQEEERMGNGFPEAEEKHLSVEREYVPRRSDGRTSGQNRKMDLPGGERYGSERTRNRSRSEQNRVQEQEFWPLPNHASEEKEGIGAIPENGNRSRKESSKVSRLSEVEKPKKTEIEVPVLFPYHPRESRKERRVKGVTMNTKIVGDPKKVGADIHEIAPRLSGKNAGLEEQPETEETMYLDLDQLSGEKKGQPQTESGLEITHEGTGEMLPLHIEGLEENTEIDGPESAEEDRSETEAASLEAWKDLEEGNEVSREERPARRSSSISIWSETNGSAGDSAGKRFGTAAGSSPEGRTVSDCEDSAEEEEWESRQTDPAFSGAAVKRKTGGQAASGEGTEGTDQTDASGPIKKNPKSSQKEIEAGIATVEAEMAKTAEIVKPEYVFPPLRLLKKGAGRSGNGQEKEVMKTAGKLQQTLNSFGVHVTVTNVSCGPSVTRYELLPEQGVKVSRIVALSDDIKLNLAAADIRIEAPIPGKAAVGIEVPNSENSTVALRDLLESEEFKKHRSNLAFAVGKDIGGKVVVADIAKMPHLLIAGATGSGKSVCINTLIMSILYKSKPEDVKLIMIDPKVVELSVYNGIPHLFIPVVTDPKKAAGALNWGVAEMTDRYNKFAEYGVRDLKGYNQKIEALKDIEDENKPKKLPQIVIIVDELADLMMVAPGEVEDSICRLAQLARAAGIHLIIATQRPSVNVITGLIKANMPSRIAFSVSSGVDSRTIIDMNGAEKLLGKGDMLFYPQGYQKPARVQGAFVSDEEVSDVVDFLKNKNTDVSYNAEMEVQIAKVQQAVSAARGAEDVDALFADAGKFIIDKDKASIGMLQRVFKIGFNRAARIMDQLSEAGVVGPEEGTKPRKILMSEEQFENYLEEN